MRARSADLHAGARSALPNFCSIFNSGGHKSIKNNRSIHSHDRLGIDYLCIAPIDYLWLILKTDSLRCYRSKFSKCKFSSATRAQHALATNV